MNKKLKISLLGLFAWVLFPAPSAAQQPLTEEKIWEMGMVGTPLMHPNAQMAVYSVRYTNLEENKGQNDLFVIDLKTKQSKQITNSPASESQYSWYPDGEWIGYLSSVSGSTQLWEMKADGTGARQVSQVEGGITGYGYSPDGKHIFYLKRVKLDISLQDKYPQLSKSTGQLFTGLLYRHWDSYHDGTYGHVFIQPYEDGKLTGNATDLLAGEKWHSPLQPFGGSEQVTWSLDSKKLIYTSKKLHGTAAATSTNADLYQYDLNTGETRNLTEGMMGYDVNPVFSPDGKKIAWLSMKRDGYEADKNRVMVMDRASGIVTDITVTFDNSANQIFWGKDSNRLFFGAYVSGTTQLYEYFFDLGAAAKTYGTKMKLLSAAPISVTTAALNHGGYAYVDNSKHGSILMQQQSMLRPAELILLDLNTKKSVTLTQINDAIYQGMPLAEVTSRQIKASDGQNIHTWVIYPPNFDATKKYPTLLYCQGGPQSMISQAFSTRWNFHLMASKGYIVVAPNRRGLPGFGQAWNEQISGDWGGQAMKDYLSAIDTIAKEPYVDTSKLGAVGASFGGYSVYWLAGNHNKRFKTFISHCGVYNLEAMYGQTEEIFFTDFEMKGSPYTQPQPASYKKFSPHQFVKNWDTPILVIHNEKDFRVPIAQGMEAFTAAQLKGIESSFLYFPDENHHVLKPQNSVLWQKVFFDWLETYLK